MKEVIFKKLKIKSFMSVGADTIEIPIAAGVNFVTGFNKDQNSYNGVGKTTIINAFFYALFGTLYGDNSGKLKQADIINNKVGGTPVVTLEFSSGGIEYVITREAKPSKCTITRNGETTNQNASISESNLEICNIIQGDSEVYSNIIIMDSDSKPFLLKENSKKLKFIENVFSLGIYSKMAKEAGSEILAKNKELTIANTSLIEVKRFKDNSKLDFTNFESGIKSKRSVLLMEIDSIVKSKSNLNLEVPADQTQILEELTHTIQTTTDRLQKGEIAKVNYKSNLDSLNAEISRLKGDYITPESLVCRLCKQSLSTHSPEDIKRHNDEVDVNIENANIKLGQANEMFKKIIAGIDKLTTLKKTSTDSYSAAKLIQNSYSEMGEKLRKIENQLEIKNAELESLSLQQNPFGDNIKKYEDEEKVLEEKVQSISEEVEILNYVKYLCSPEGVKAHIISKIVGLFNIKLNGFLHKLGSQFNITFDEFFEANIKNFEGAEVSYHSLSGGERKRVELACLFAFKEIRRMQSNISINVTMMDELLDSGLCVNGLDSAMGILQDSADTNGESIFIITHRASQIDDIPNSKVLFLEKENGVTKLVDFK